MVIIDGMKLPPKKIMISIGVLILLIIGTVFGYLHKQKVQADELKKMQQQKIQQEQSQRSSYEAGINAMFDSANLNSLFHLYGLLLKDFSFMHIAGWEHAETLCEVNSCNMKFKKVKDRMFEYVTIKKGETTYDPIFNQDDMTYQNVIYAIDKVSNQSMKDKMDNIIGCTDFVSDAYQLNSILNLGQGSSQKLIINLPSDEFSLSQEYEWAPYSKIKKGTLEFKTSNFYTVNYIKDKYKGQLLAFTQLGINNKGEINVTMSYYCF